MYKRQVPTSDLAFYASKYLGSRISKLRSGEGRLSWWGPKFEGMEKITPDTPLEEVAAVQWERCISLATEQLSEIPVEQVVTIKYQELARDAYKVLEGLTTWLGESPSETALTIAANAIHAGSVGNWRTALSPEQVDRLSPIVAPALQLAGLKK